MTVHRFSVMDGLRGVAAMAVVLLHSFADRRGLPNGVLAVDFFFIMSGFVIAYSYEAKLAGTLTKRAFLLNRFTRLYPMVIFGAAGGLALALVHNRTNPDSAYPLAALAISGTLSILVLPYLGNGIRSQDIFSFNPPLWSLFDEVLANIVYALFRKVLNTYVLALLVVASLLAIAWIGPLGGSYKSTLLFGFPRVVAGFFGGVLLFRLWNTGRLAKPRAGIVTLGAVIALVFCFPREIGGWGYIPAFAILWLVVLASANARASKFDRYSQFLGDVSYPIYLSHIITLYLATFAGKKIGIPYNAVVVVHFLAMPFIGLAIGRVYETPFRNALKSLVNRRAPPRPPHRVPAGIHSPRSSAGDSRARPQA